MTIKLTNILTFDNPENYKVHLANWNGKHQPLNVFVSSLDEWKTWNEWRGEKDEFNRQFIFSLIDFYHEEDMWLFAGCYEVVERFEKRYDFGYKVELTDQFAPFIGRLKIKWNRSARAKSRKLEGLIEELAVSEILPQKYTGEVFCGYENINHDFHILESIFRFGKQDWKAALANVKGVYLITDKDNGKKYVGSAYGESGLWSRWACYMETGHGYNDDLTKLIGEKGLDYARENFQFSLLEYRSMKTDDDDIIAREAWWKKALLSREFGYNNN